MYEIYDIYSPSDKQKHSMTGNKSRISLYYIYATLYQGGEALVLAAKHKQRDQIYRTEFDEQDPNRRYLQSGLLLRRSFSAGFSHRNGDHPWGVYPQPQAEPCGQGAAAGKRKCNGNCHEISI